MSARVDDLTARLQAHGWEEIREGNAPEPRADEQVVTSSAQGLAPQEVGEAADFLSFQRSAGLVRRVPDPSRQDGGGYPETPARLRHPSFGWRCSCPCPMTFGSYIDGGGAIHVVAVHCEQTVHTVVDHAGLMDGYSGGESVVMDLLPTYPDAAVIALSYFDEQRQFFRAETGALA